MMHATTRAVSWLLASGLAQQADESTAVEVSSVFTATDPTTTPTATPPATSPVVSLFLPMGSQEHIGASIISVDVNQTAFALGCVNDTTTSQCGYNPPITVTEGESTMIYTNTYGGNKSATGLLPMTYQCVLEGAHLDITPIKGAISAVCTASSAIDGLGIMAATNTLAHSEIIYQPVTVTAGAEKLAPASSTIPVPGVEATNTAGAPMVVVATRMGWIGAVGFMVLGLV